MQLWKIAIRHMTWVDWLFCVSALGIAVLPLATHALNPAPVHQGAEALFVWPTVRPVTLNPEISLGNVLALGGMMFWIGRWGAKQLLLLNELPELLVRMNKRLRRLEISGCSQFAEHSTILNNLAKRGVRPVPTAVDPLEIPDDDLVGQGCLKP